MGLSEAAAATGVNRSTIFRAYKSGRMSAQRTDTGQIVVEPVELFRVFPPIAAQGAPQEAMHLHAMAAATGQTDLRASALEVEVKLLREMLDAMREDRNAWRDQASKVTASLPPPVPATVRRPWWRRMTGR
jgi:hypothetical protein